MRPISLTGGRVLLPEGEAVADLRLEDGRIAALDGGARGLRMDTSGLLVLPGVVDIHGDAFERQIQPRPGVDFPARLALRDTEAQLLANGITTAFHGVTLSWEPGLRGLETWRALLDALAAEPWTCDMRVHLRWEAYNLDALDTALEAIAEGRVHLLAFNDHTPAILRKLRDPVAGAKYSERAGMALPAFHALAERIAGYETDVPAALERIAAAARAARIPIASHDDATITARDAFRVLGARICEFPMAEEVARAARGAGDAVVMGSPNVVRGRSHLGWASAERMVGDGVCTVLSSDYYYPAMAHAALRLAKGGLGLARAWALVSAAAADAAGLADRGRIQEGLRADIVMVDPASSQVVATIAGGRLAYLSAGGATRLSSQESVG
jgi:alpha-D-ribose 1-methylphosphonate 5-triphosphate diphosphatase